MLSSMLKDEVAARIQDILPEDLVRYGFESIKGIGRIGEDDVKFLFADRQEVEYVVVHRCDFVKPKTSGFVPDEGGVVPVHLHAEDA